MCAESVERDTVSSRSTDFVVLAVLCTGMFMAILDVNAVNVAAANLQRQLGASLSALTWIVDGYNLTLAGFMLSGGILADRFGKRLIWGLGLMLFLFASLGWGLSHTVEELVTFRLVQGVGAALFVPASFSLITDIWPDPAVRQRVIGLFAGMIAISAAIGPVLGGVMVDVFGWRSLFLVNLPIGAFGLGLARGVLPVSRPCSTRSLDIPGQILSFLALAATCYVLIQLPLHVQTTVPLVLASMLAVICFMGFLVVEWISPAPGIPFSLFQVRELNWANLTGVCINICYFGGIYMLGLILQNRFFLTPIQTGVALLPLAVCLILGNIFAGRLVEYLGARRQIAIGLVFSAFGYAGMLCLQQGYGILCCVAMIALAGGIAFVIPPMTATILQGVAPEMVGTASAIHTTCRQIGTLLGVVFASLVLSFFQDALVVFMISSAVVHALLAVASIWVFRAKAEAD